MLTEAKKALRVTVDAYDTEIARLLEAGAKDLETAGVILPGTVVFSEEGGAVTDASTLADPLAMQAVITYAAMMFGNPPNFERLRDSYDLQKTQLMHAAAYTSYESGDAG